VSMAPAGTPLGAVTRGAEASTQHTWSLQHQRLLLYWFGAYVPCGAENVATRCTLVVAESSEGPKGTSRIVMSGCMRPLSPPPAGRTGSQAGVALTGAGVGYANDDALGGVIA
jgi:hypothetical protein